MPPDLAAPSLPDCAQICDLTIIIVSYNTCALLLRCIDSIIRHAEELTLQIVVSDNASTDGTAAELQRQFPSVTLILNDKNLGFAAANNRALALSSGRYLLFLNPDILLLEPVFRKMIGFLESHPDAGVLGCTLLNSDGTVQKSWHQNLPTLANRFLEALYLEKLFDRQDESRRIAGPLQVKALAGACLFMRRSLAERLGGFDESFFLYCEDMDLCCRVRKEGLSIYYLGDLAMLHYQGASSKTRMDYFEKVMTKESVYTYFLKHGGKPRAVAYKISMAMASIFRLLVLFTWVPATRALGKHYSFHPRASVRKYLHVLYWGIGLENWTKKPG